MLGMFSSGLMEDLLLGGGSGSSGMHMGEGGDTRSMAATAVSGGGSLFSGSSGGMPSSSPALQDFTFSFGPPASTAFQDAAVAQAYPQGVSRALSQHELGTASLHMPPIAGDGGGVGMLDLGPDALSPTSLLAGSLMLPDSSLHAADAAAVDAAGGSASTTTTTTTTKAGTKSRPRGRPPSAKKARGKGRGRGRGRGRPAASSKKGRGRGRGRGRPAKSPRASTTSTSSTTTTNTTNTKSKAAKSPRAPNGKGKNGGKATRGRRKKSANGGTAGSKSPRVRGRAKASRKMEEDADMPRPPPLEIPGDTLTFGALFASPRPVSLDTPTSTAARGRPRKRQRTTPLASPPTPTSGSSSSVSSATPTQAKAKAKGKGKAAKARARSRSRAKAKAKAGASGKAKAAAAAAAAGATITSSADGARTPGQPRVPSKEHTRFVTSLRKLGVPEHSREAAWYFRPDSSRATTPALNPPPPPPPPPLAPPAVVTPRTPKEAAAAAKKKAHDMDAPPLDSSDSEYPESDTSGSDGEEVLWQALVRRLQLASHHAGIHPGSAGVAVTTAATATATGPAPPAVSVSELGNGLGNTIANGGSGGGGSGDFAEAQDADMVDVVGGSAAPARATLHQRQQVDMMAHGGLPEGGLGALYNSLHLPLHLPGTETTGRHNSFTRSSVMTGAPSNVFHHHTRPPGTLLTHPTSMPFALCPLPCHALLCRHRR